MSLGSLNIPLYCINLFERTDRHHSLVQEFTKRNLPYSLLQTYRHPRGGIVGCKNAWLQTLRMAYDRGDDYCIIVEDDFYFIDQHYALVCDHLRHFIENEKQDWSMLYLHHDQMVITTASQSLPHFFFKGSILSTTGILFSRYGMKLVLDLQPIAIRRADLHFDVFLTQFVPNKFIMKKPLVGIRNFSGDTNWSLPKRNQFIVRGGQLLIQNVVGEDEWKQFIGNKSFLRAYKYAPHHRERLQQDYVENERVGDVGYVLKTILGI